jgi:hypothetical protein
MFRRAMLFMLMTAVIYSAGCTSVLVTGAGGGVAYTVTNVAYKAVNYPMDQVQSAIHAALNKMAIRDLQTLKTERGVRIISETMDLKIYIDLDWITQKTTRISVDAKRNVIIKDLATATAIIERTESILEGKNN